MSDSENQGYWSQHPLVLKHEERNRLLKALNEIIEQDTIEAIGTGSNFKYEGSDDTLTTGDAVSYEDESSGIVNGIVVDMVEDQSRNGLLCVKVRDLNGNESWGDPKALTLLRPFECHYGPDCITASTDTYCPFVGGRCRDDCVMNDEDNFCVFACAMSYITGIAVGYKGLQIGDDWHGIASIAGSIDRLRKIQMLADLDNKDA